MRLSPRQLATVALLCVCLLAAILLCLFAPFRVALIAVIITLAVCTLAILVFLRKVLSAVYQLRITALTGPAPDADVSTTPVQNKLSTIIERLDRIEQHLPERLAARVAFELAHQADQAPNAQASSHQSDAAR